MIYVRWPGRRNSVHVFVTHTRAGQILTRCGRRMDVGELLDTLPLGERSCENCLRFASRDEQPVVANDPVDPDVADDEVTP